MSGHQYIIFFFPHLTRLYDLLHVTQRMPSIVNGLHGANAHITVEEQKRKEPEPACRLTNHYVRIVLLTLVHALTCQRVQVSNFNLFRLNFILGRIPFETF